MKIEPELKIRAETDPCFAARIVQAGMVISSSDNSIVRVIGRPDVTREVFDGIDTIYVTSAVPFVARETIADQRDICVESAR